MSPPNTGKKVFERRPPHRFLILSDSEDGLFCIKDIANPDFMFLAWIQYLVCHVSFLHLGF